ncbi:hypothetical protein B0T26DRAFT_657139 [Lasiosphaeria miniovina]|uniref:Uncharacterized protein n=1 Tax=Lasiosphaeria miniovina TaxID=1954250 RepID=A0AA40DJR1_9PEZI|nr:uncharacterized protein B0T26DRAFT_657139 [Lasiosphaeria miniovina]KAK0703911.1 hypothetical protein B0T26DRAFT_657139 [Lasiosphaeria miniovina]
MSYPGVQLPLRYFPQGDPYAYPSQPSDHQLYRRGAHPHCVNSTSDLLMVREVAMMILMERLTDKPDWHKKIFDKAIIDKWRDETLTQPEDALYARIVDGKDTTKIPKPRCRIMSPACFDYCIQELRCKAAFFKQTGLVYTLNTRENNIIKSDTVVSADVHSALRAAFGKLRAAQAADPDWHPWTNEVVLDLVHPSLYPFVYGQTKFIPDEAVGVVDAVDKWANKGEPVSKTPPVDSSLAGWRGIPDSFWSDTYQWLPANLAFNPDGTVRFTSYINNLHPKRHAEIYRVIEKLVDIAVPAWECALTGGVQFNDAYDMKGSPVSRFGQPPEAWDEDTDSPSFWEPLDPQLLAATEKQNGPLPFNDYELSNCIKYGNFPEGSSDQEIRERVIAQLKWRGIRDPVLTEPIDFSPLEYSCRDRLGQKFKETGLQVIVKMATVELTPDKPEFPVGGWHIEGMMNEHIAATALYYLDSENVTTSSLSFRMQTDEDQEELVERTAQDDYEYYERLFGTSLGPGRGPPGLCLQNYGDVETCQGRLLAFPNVFQHRVSSFELEDPTKPGHRSFIALWLVDPHQRIISTANVPPQQLDWWAKAVFGSSGTAAGEPQSPVKGQIPPEVLQILLEQGVGKGLKLSGHILSSLHGRLPAEVVDMVRAEGKLAEGLMTLDEARQHRVALMEERSHFHQRSEGEWNNTEYSFCEH